VLREKLFFLKCHPFKCFLFSNTPLEFVPHANRKKVIKDIDKI